MVNHFQLQATMYVMKRLKSPFDRDRDKDKVTGGVSVQIKIPPTSDNSVAHSFIFWS